jgi:hypothetical protein
MEEIENSISNAINFHVFKVSEEPNKQVNGGTFEITFYL